MDLTICPTLSQLSQDSNGEYICSYCDLITSNKKDYKKHIQTKKHLKNMNSAEKNTKNTEYLTLFNKNITKKSQISLNNICCKCNKNYKSRVGLWYHNKKCKTAEENTKNPEEIEEFPEEVEEKQEISGPINTTMILELLKQNNEFKELLIEQNKKILELVGTSSVTNNNNITNNTTNNNKFNLNIFLNEKCKDAYNIDEFIDGVNVVFKDFENFGKIGYVSSINHILIRELKEIDIYKRPIHCSDLKREVIHVKDNNVWVKDDDKKYMKRAIRRIEHKNIQLITEYAKAYPEVNDATSKRSDEYDKMMYNSMGESTDEGNERNYEKIIRTVAKQVLIDKEK